MSPEHRTRKQSPAAQNEAEHFLDGVYQPYEPPDFFPHEAEEKFPPEFPIVHEIMATARVIFGLGHRNISGQNDRWRPIRRRNVTMALTDPTNPDKVVFRRVTTAVSSLKVSLPKTSTRGVQTENQENSLRRQARNSGGRKRKIGLW